MRTIVVIACFSLTATTIGCTTPEVTPAATNPPPAAVSVCTASVDVVQTATNTSAVAAAEEPPKPLYANIKTVKITYPDVPKADFHLSDWAIELAAKAEEGIHIRNGNVLVVARIPYDENTAQMLQKTQTKFRAVQILRKICPELPQTVSMSCRILVNEADEEGKWQVCVMALTESALSEMTNGGK